MNVREIVTKYLKDMEYDGLCCDGVGCLIDDLMPCTGLWDSGPELARCKPGYKTKCDPETCPADGDCPWHVGPEKETNRKEAE